VNAAQFLIDTSALARFMHNDAERHGWEQTAAAGLIAVCPSPSLKLFVSGRSAVDRAQGVEDMRLVFGWVPVDDRAYDRAWQVQEALTKRGQHRSAGPGRAGPGRAGPADLVVAATAELQDWLSCIATGTWKAFRPSRVRRISGSGLQLGTSDEARTPARASGP